MEISSFTLALLRSRFKWRRRRKSKFRKFEPTTIPPQCLMVFLNSWWKSSWTSDPVDFTGNAFRKSSHTESFTQLRCENLFCCSILTSGMQYLHHIKWLEEQFEKKLNEFRQIARAQRVQFFDRVQFFPNCSEPFNMYIIKWAPRWPSNWWFY